MYKASARGKLDVVVTLPNRGADISWEDDGCLLITHWLKYLQILHKKMRDAHSPADAPDEMSAISGCKRRQFK